MLHLVAAQSSVEPSLEAASPGAAARDALAELADRTTRLRSHNAELVERQRIFDLALEAGGAGVWRCELSTNAIEWTGGVYDMFDLPRGADIRREDVLPTYEPQSLATLERLRSEAILTGGTFGLDAEIMTPKGRRRWIRIAGRVELAGGRAVRLFGMKQDVTEARETEERQRRLAEVDALTGLANRAMFEARLSDAGRRIAGECPRATLILVDLDAFKQMNDTFGHATGDICLRTAAARLGMVCAEAELVARIGGDEFAVFLGEHHGRGAVERIARSIVEALRVTVERDGRKAAIGASVGVAFSSPDAPWRQFREADAALYAAKAAGGGGFVVAPAMAPAAAFIEPDRAAAG